ncbi:16S rRNA (cytidine(1402)-2'-O)-methyltransferase [Actinomyces sp. B33]|uniref:16S rRNA (cytidine(1402)-2'-O)-methyltransferase n=1 Tax=Actinomyces sp. B33 TaxID=2942131 RepID=UPI00233F814B|nr:16S rRNA (cytidine(1402)-2'-O)-methyltransferase [Actinomyces sp. B33]MDC4233713.1 16S rRNA (cytidine(1402)-2'-O)-methyltransferase [Actinomyces sp. B33]
MAHDIRALDPGAVTLAATPIGDSADASARFIAALAQADVIAAEDTRRLLALASRLDVTPSGRLLALHDHNEADRASRLVDEAERGGRVLLVSDAGMPTVSDPGYRVVREAVVRGVPVTSIPGPSAALAALAVSGLPSDRFSFEGFLPRKDGEARRALDALARDPRTMIFFESPKRLHETLERMAGAFGPDRRAVVCRELTKTHEEVLRGTLADLVAATADGVLGEITVVVAGWRGTRDPADHVDAVLALADEGMRLKDAAADVARATGLRTNDLYAAVLARRAGG